MRKIALVLMLILTYQTAADEESSEPFSLSLRELLDVSVVTVNKREQSVSEVPAAVTVLTSSDIELLGFNTLHDAMEYVVGVSSVSGENNVWHGYSIRGDTVVNYNTKTLLLIDGYRVQNPLFGSFDLTSIPVTAIAKIEVIKGARSVEYGSNAVNAVINVITHKREESGGELRARIGEEGTMYLAANWTEVTGDWKIAGYAETHETDNQNLVSNSERGEQVQYNKYLRNHNLTLDISNDNLQFFGMFHRRILPNFLTRSFTFVRETDVRANLLGVKYRHEIKPELQASIQVSRYAWEADRDFFRIRDEVDNMQLLTLDSYSNEVSRRIYYNARLTEAIAELDWIKSPSFQMKLGASYSDSYGTRFQTTIDDFDIGKFKDKTDQWAIYANAEYQLTDDIRAFAGVRYDDSNYQFSGTGETTDFDDLSKELSVVWAINEQNTLKLIYGESFRVPTYFEKEADTASTVGNADLDPEYSDTFDLVFVRLTDVYKWDIGIFRADTSGTIGRGTAPDGRRQNQNLGESNIVGLESNIKWQLRDARLFGFGGFGFYDGESEDAVGTEEDLPFTYDYMLTLGAGYEVSEHWAVTTSVKTLSDWGEAPSYTVVNAGVRGQFSGLPGFVFAVDVRNILGEDVYLPEVSRANPDVPFFPVSSDSLAQVGVTYRF